MNMKLKGFLSTLALAMTLGFGAQDAGAATLLSTEFPSPPVTTPDELFGSPRLVKCNTETDGDSPVTCTDWEEGLTAAYESAFTLTYTDSASGYSFDWTFDPAGITDALFPRYVAVKQATFYQVWELDASEYLGGSIATGLNDISHVSFYDGRVGVIPLPAAGWLLLGGLGGLAALRRRRKAA